MISLDNEVIHVDSSFASRKEPDALTYQHIHAHGEGDWVSNKPSKWRLAKINIESYDIIEHMSSKDALLKMRQLGGIDPAVDKSRP